MPLKDPSDLIHSPAFRRQGSYLLKVHIYILWECEMRGFSILRLLVNSYVYLDADHLILLRKATSGLSKLQHHKSGGSSKVVLISRLCLKYSKGRVDRALLHTNFCAFWPSINLILEAWCFTTLFCLHFQRQRERLKHQNTGKQRNSCWSVWCLLFVYENATKRDAEMLGFKSCF